MARPDSKYAPPQLTVRGLMEMLASRPLDSLVIIEGCDCLGKACAVLDPSHAGGRAGAVVIARTDSDLFEENEGEVP